MFRLSHIKQNEILDDGASDGGAAPVVDPADNNTTDPASVLDDNANLAATGGLTLESVITGFEGDELAKAQNYAKNYTDDNGNLNVASMIKSGFNLESKFGSFTGAPEAYTIGTPDYLDGDVNLEDPYLMEFQEMAKASNMSQEGFEKFMDIHLRASIAPPVDITQLGEEIGPEFNDMRANMAGFFKTRLDGDSFAALQGMITSKESFQALYNVFKASKPTKFDDSVRENFNQAELKDQMDAEYMANDSHGNPKMRDPIYAKSWRERWGPFINKSDI